MKTVKKSPKKPGKLLNSHVIHSQIARTFANEATMKLTNHSTDPNPSDMNSDSSPDYSPGNSATASSGSSSASSSADTTTPSTSGPGESADSVSHPQEITGVS